MRTLKIVPVYLSASASVCLDVKCAPGEVYMCILVAGILSM